MMVNALSNKLAHDITRRDTWLIAPRKKTAASATVFPNILNYASSTSRICFLL